MMPQRLSIVGEREKPDHAYLSADARCYFWGEYTPYNYTDGKRWNFSPTNKLISNFKKSLDRQDSSDWKYKQQAINEVAKAFAGFWQWDAFHRETLLSLIPMPPSKAPSDPLYDDRVFRTLTCMADYVQLPLDIRDCLRFNGKYEASHSAPQRPKPDELYEALNFDEAAGRLDDQPNVILLFDDMLTTGAHFCAAKQKLGEYYPETEVIGMFIARRVIPYPFDELDPSVI